MKLIREDQGHSRCPFKESLLGKSDRCAEPSVSRDWAREEGKSGSVSVSKNRVFSGQKKIWNAQEGNRLKGRRGSGGVSWLCGSH